jgi:arylsulfatase
MWALSPDDQKIYAHEMEVFAGFLAYTDHEVGRLINAIDQIGELDNTLVFYIVGDNGASAEGGLAGSVNELKVFNKVPESREQLLASLNDLGSPKTFNHYHAAWAWAGTTPFQWTKQIASHFGGTRNPLIIAWGDRIKDQGGLRSQFHHVIDITPTIFEAAGITAPTKVNGVKQQKIEGTSLVYTFDDSEPASERKTQYFEMFGNRAIYNNGWIAAGRIEKTLPYRLALNETFDVGRDTGTPIVETYQVPFAFTGNLQKVTLNLK